MGAMRIPTGTAALLGFFALFLVAAGAAPAAAPRFRLAVLKASYFDLGLGPDWTYAWPLLELAAGDVLLAIDELDVAAYDWQDQRIVLTPEVSLRLLAAAQELPGASERLCKLRALWLDDDLKDILANRGFVVSIDGRPLYGGILGHYTSVLYPVILAAMDDSRRIELRLLPAQFPDWSWDDGLEFLDADWREEVEALQRLILDPRIESLFAGLGTPARPPPVVAPARPAPPVVAPVRLGVDADWDDIWKSWELRFLMPDEVAEVRYRLAGRDSDWIATVREGPIGELEPGCHRVDVEALDFAGEPVGTYTLWLDPDREMIASYRNRLERTPDRWVRFEDHEDETRLSFFPDFGYGGALAELRYSIDDCGLDRRIPLAHEKLGVRGGPFFEALPEAAAFVCVQLVYRDGVTNEPRRFYRHPEQDPGPPSTAPPVDAGPVSLSVGYAGSSWTLYFVYESEWLIRRIQYRFAGEPEWHTTGPAAGIDLITGERLPRSWVVLETHKVTLGRHRIEVVLTDWDGVEHGPYGVGFDPEREIVNEAKDWAFDPELGWVDFLTETLFSISILDNAMDGLREVRYSIDGCELDRRLPFRPWTYLGEDPGHHDYSMVRVPDPVGSVCVQLVFRDGEVTEPRLYHRQPDE